MTDEATSLNVGICQINLKVGDLEGNAAKIVESARHAAGQGADIVAFPELALTGYPPEDLLLKPAFIRACGYYLDHIAEELPELVLLVGFPEQLRRLHNAAAFMHGGMVQAVYRKRLLPNYAVFDEQRYFVPGSGEHKLFDVGGVKVGVSICEDIWSPTGPALDQVQGGADVILNINASPYFLGRRWQRSSMLSTRASDMSTPIVYVNMVGGQDELVFDGGSLVYDSYGTLKYSFPQFEEVIETVRVPLGAASRKYQLDPRGLVAEEELETVPIAPSLPVGSTHVAYHPADHPAFLFEPSPSFEKNWVSDLSDFYLDEVLGALKLGLTDYVEKNRFSRVVIALSGGIDSSICAALAVEAIGPERVTGISMPSRYSSEGSVGDAQKLADNLGIELLIAEIERMHTAFSDVIGKVLGAPPQGLTDENLQSRIRAVLIMAYSNATGALVITTGNKSEIATGYSTLYGDSAGGFALIKDIPKLLVYRLCERINAVAGREVIPSEVLLKPPSAELRPGQRDVDSLPPYEELDPILMALVERDMTPMELVGAGYDSKLVTRVAGLIDRSEYKRRQAAPGVRITPKSFGKDRRMPITNGFDPEEVGFLEEP
ncbi:MAG: NAD+ synthase [Actinomycetota bacterium]|nr:NAD+ synthase [Actinomycetota bacterium]